MPFLWNYLVDGERIFGLKMYCPIFDVIINGIIMFLRFNKIANKEACK